MKDWHIYKKWYFWVIVLIITIFESISESSSFDPLIFLAYFLSNFVFTSLIWGTIFLLYLILKNLKNLILKKNKNRE